MELKKQPIFNRCVSLDERQIMQYCEALHNDPEIRHLFDSLAILELNSLPVAILVQENIEVRYVYAPEYYRVRTMIESQIQVRMNQIKQHYPLIIKYYK